jgi:hypothetical protein
MPLFPGERTTGRRPWAKCYSCARFCARGQVGYKGIPTLSGYSSSPRSAAFDEELEELGEESIIAAEQGAHVPAARAAVKEERESVVISDYPPPQSGRRRSGRHAGRGDATVVIRDKRRIEAMRRALLDSHRPPKPNRSVLLWVGAALAAFLIGGVAAVVVARGEASSRLPAIPTSTAHVTSAPPRTESVAEKATEAARAIAPESALPKAQASSTPAAIDLEDLPVERPTRR